MKSLYEIVWLFKLGFPECGEEIQDFYEDRNSAIEAVFSYIKNSDRNWVMIKDDSDHMEWKSVDEDGYTVVMTTATT